MSAVTATYLLDDADEDFGPRSDGIVTLHTAESVYNRLTVADAIILARWQDRSDVLGSYGRIICTDGVLLTVPDDHASGGINPASAYFNPRAWLYDYLDADEVRNPNYFTLNLCAMGRQDWFEEHGWPPEIIDGFARSIIDEERRIGRPVVVTNHSDFQPGNRTDAGAMCMNLVMKRYQELTALPEEDMILLPVQTYTAGTRAGFAEKTTYDFYRIVNGEIERKRWTTTGATSALALARMVLNGDTKHAGILIGNGIHEGWICSGWGNRPTISIPAPTGVSPDELAAANEKITAQAASFRALQEQAASDFEGLSIRAADSAKRIRTKKP